MRPERTEAIILNTFPARERDKLVVFLTPDHGKKKGWAYGARSLKSRFGAALEPLAKVRIAFLERESDEVVRIESVDLLRSLFPAQQNLVANVAASYIAETVDTFAQSGDPAELIYRLLDRTTEALLEGADPMSVVAYAEVWMLRLGGILPDLPNRVGLSFGRRDELRHPPRGGAGDFGDHEPVFENREGRPVDDKVFVLRLDEAIANFISGATQLNAVRLTDQRVGQHLQMRSRRSFSEDEAIAELDGRELVCARDALANAGDVVARERRHRTCLSRERNCRGGSEPARRCPSSAWPDESRRP